MNGTLPLFDGLEPPASGGDGESPARPAAAGRASAPANSEKHLRAAWRLSRSMWRYPERSPEQTRAGVAICRHLQALLAASEDGGRRG